MTPSKSLFLFSLSFILGVFLNSFFKVSLTFILLFLILGIFSISIFWKHKNLVVIGLSILFLILGILRYQTVFTNLTNSKIKSFFNERVTLIGIVDEEPEFQEGISRLKIRIEKENARILVKTQRYPEYKYGDKLKIIGKLEEPKVFEGFNYKNYLLKEKIIATVDFPEIEKIGQGFENPFKKHLFNFKNKFKQKTEEFILPPQIGILEALIFGDESQIPKELKKELNLTGVRHITAVSGMNITILCSLILNFILIFGFWRRDAILVSLFLIFLYVLMIGAPPSAIRAAIMGSLSLIAQLFGRYSFGVRPLAFAAAIMIFQNPLILRYDIGFQLSFLAILGLIYYQEFFSHIFKKIPNSNIFPIRNTLATTFSAQIFTLPILIYNFGNFPLLSPITNLLIVPFLPHLTIFIFIFGIFAMFSLEIGYLLSLPTHFFLTLILKIIDFFFKIPFSHFSFKISWFWLIIFYIVLTLTTWRIQEDQKLKFLKY